MRPFAGGRAMERTIRGVLVLLLVAGLLPGIAAQARDRRERGAPEPQIVGGTPVPIGGYPFVVALLNKTYQGSPLRRQFCGGSLIDATHVLTAAHCVSGRTRTGDLRVVVGRTLLNDKGVGQVVGVERIARSGEDDVAVLRLREAVEGVPPVALAGAGQAPQAGAQATTSGWGYQAEGRRSRKSNNLLEVDVPIVADDACVAAYDGLHGANPIDPTTMVCAGAKGIDSCFGDSGGPLFVEENGAPVQIGVVSFGEGCAREGYPGVYVEVAAPGVAAFIEAAISAS